VVPTIGVPIGWLAHLSAPDPASQRLLCWERGQSPHLSAWLRACPSQPLSATGAPQLLTARPGECMLQQRIHIAIGPEGGWTPAEVDAALAAGYQAVSLGPRILRAVTAPLAALAIIAAHFEAAAQPNAQPASIPDPRQD
jgi:16S rRNA (uracil1498-N3)-methyltransferase